MSTTERAPPEASFRERVYAAVRDVPHGRVASYGAIAASIGQPRAARAVGNALRRLDGDDAEVPWWRVLNGAGEIAPRGAFHDAAVQRALLEAEGVRFGANGRVDWHRFGWSGRADAPRPAAPVKPLRHAVSVAIRHPDGGAATLLVRRPPDDAELPGAWGLPAASRAHGESAEDAVRRAGREKLGIELAVGSPLRSGSLHRAGYELRMTLFDATILSGAPAAPQPHPHVTQYTAWCWGHAPDLAPAAERGSLCCRLFLDHAAAAPALPNKPHPARCASARRG